MTTTARKRQPAGVKRAPTPPATPLTDEYMRSGQWNPLWDQLRALDPRFVEAYLNFRETPQRNGPLPRHVKELILVAINAATTHLYAPGVRRHIAARKCWRRSRSPRSWAFTPAISRSRFFAKSGSALSAKRVPLTVSQRVRASEARDPSANRQSEGVAEAACSAAGLR